MEVWSQVYDPLGNTILSTLVCAIPVLVLLGGLGIFHIKAHYAAVGGLLAAMVIALFVLGMPSGMAARAGFYGALFAITTVCWIILNLIFLYRMTVKAGLFSVLQDSVGGITNDRRLQLVLIAFCFGAFFEGAAGGGTPVAVTGAILIGLGFQSAGGVGAVADRQYGAGGLWRFGHAHRRAGERHRFRSAEALGDGRAPAAVLLGDRAVLADGDVLRVSQNARDLARHPGRRHKLRGPAVPHLQFPRPLARGHALRDAFHAVAGAVPQGLEAQARDAGCFGERWHGHLRGSAKQSPGSRSRYRAGGQGLDTLGHPYRRAGDLGHSHRSRIF